MIYDFIKNVETQKEKIVKPRYREFIKNYIGGLWRQCC